MSDSPERHRIGISAPSADARDVVVTLDDQPVKGLVSVQFRLEAQRIVSVTLEIETEAINVDAKVFEYAERHFESRPEK